LHLLFLIFLSPSSILLFSLVFHRLHLMLLHFNLLLLHLLPSPLLFLFLLSHLSLSLHIIVLLHHHLLLCSFLRDLIHATVLSGPESGLRPRVQTNDHSNNRVAFPFVSATEESRIVRRIIVNQKLRDKRSMKDMPIRSLKKGKNMTKYGGFHV
jgi:hypothetical protein